MKYQCQIHVSLKTGQNQKYVGFAKNIELNLHQTTDLVHIGFGTVNGKDGHAFKTREGGVMRLEYLVKEVEDKMLEKIKENGTMEAEEAKATASIVALSAIKYGDLSNQASKDYIFDIDRFTSAEGNTGPYILYTIVRCKSILKKAEFAGNDGVILAAHSDSERGLQLELTKFISALNTAYEEMAPHKICAYIYDLANAFNRFYHDTKILAEEDVAKKNSYLALLNLTKEILEKAIELLGFEAPERM